MKINLGQHQTKCHRQSQSHHQLVGIVMEIQASIYILNAFKKNET